MKERRSPWLRRLRWIYLAVVLAGFAMLLWRHGDELRALRRVWAPGLLLTLVLATGQFVVHSAFWWRALRRLGQAVDLRHAVRAGMEAVPARYLPGSLWFSVGRAGLLWHRGASKSSLVVTGGLENVLSLLVVFSVGSVLYAFQTATFGLLAAPLALFVASPPCLRTLGRRIPRLHLPEPITWSLFGELVAWMTLFWCWSATTFGVFLQSFPQLAAEIPFPEIAAAFLISWGVGYLAVFAPQGVGVFEVSLAALLGIGAGGGGLPVAWVTVAAGYRALILVRDLLLALGAACWPEEA